MAHKLGGEFHIPHGRANAVLLPFVIEYNGVKSPSKFVSFPKYEHYIAAEKYAEIAKELGLEFQTAEEGVKALANAVRGLMKEVNIPLSLKECGIEKDKFEQKIEYLAINAFEDQCTTANPRLPLIGELKEIYKKAYMG